MSEAEPEPIRRTPPPQRGQNLFTRKIGPLPGWGWIAVAAGAAGVYIWWKNRSASTAAATTAATTPAASTTGVDYGAELATLQAEVQQLQGSESGEPSSGGGGGGGAKYYRHVSTGKETLTQLVTGRHTSVAHILDISRKAPESAKNLAALEDWAKHPRAKRKGVVYYTGNP